MTWMTVLISFVFLLAYLLLRGGRTATDVLIDLSEERGHSGVQADVGVRRATLSTKRRSQEESEQEFYQAGIFKREERLRFQRSLRRRPIVVSLLIGSLALCAFQNAVAAIFAFVFGLSGTYLVGRRSLLIRKKKFLRDINFFLPVVMERLVMTAQAGLDVFSGIRVVSELAHADAERLKEPIDPVTLLLEKVHYLNERGLGFEEALSEVSGRIESPALRHAFIHLAVAQKEGGELVAPLRELSDSTQAYFQETVEEEIAKLPVKATMPLMVTFAGLVIFFMTSPMIQIIKLSAGGIAK